MNLPEKFRRAEVAPRDALQSESHPIDASE